MPASQVSWMLEGWGVENGRREALDRCCSLLKREGFTVSLVLAPSAKRKIRPPDILAANGGRVVRVLVLQDGDLDDVSTKARIRAAIRQGETRVYAPWPMRWRLLSNLERWKIRGVAVAGW